MSGFWAGAVPPWAYAVGACLFILAVLLGMWAGYDRGFKHAAEEQRWEREQAKARRVHAVYREGPAWPLFERAHEARLASEDQALAIANGQPEIYPPGDPRHDWDPSCRQRGCPVHGNWDQPGTPAITTGEIQAITDRVDEWMATWIGDGHALRDR